MANTIVTPNLFARDSLRFQIPNIGKLVKISCAKCELRQGKGGGGRIYRKMYISITRLPEAIGIVVFMAPWYLVPV